MPLRRLVVAVALAVTPATIAGPRDDLLQLVPDDYTFCVVVQNLRDQSTGNGFLKNLSEAPLIKGLQSSPEAKKFQEVFEGLLKELGVTPEQLRDDLFGDAFVFAYRKGPPGQEGKEDGLILLHARDDKLLQRVVDRIVEIQTKAGEIKTVEPVGTGDGRYFRRVKMVETEAADFYAVQGHRLAFSGSEALLKNILPRLSKTGGPEPAIARRMKQLGVNEAPAAVLVNPRSFDADVATGAQAAKGSEQAFLKQFSNFWKAVDGLALFVNLQPAIEVGLSLNVRKAELPAAAAKFFTEAGKRSPLWDRIPDDALFAVAGRIHVESLAAMLRDFLAEPDRAKVLEGIADATRPFLETEDFAALARGIGPDVGLWVTAPDPASKTWCPRIVAAMKMGDGPKGKDAERAALQGLDFLARLASLQHKGLRVHTDRQGPVEVRYLTHPSAFPPGFRPAFAAKGGYVVAADSPETLAKFDAPTGPATDADEVPILRLSATAWRAYLKQHQDSLLNYLAGLKAGDPKEYARHIETLLPLLDGLDRLEVVQRSAPDRATLIVRLREVRSK
jgi:hypothetical protein